MTLIKLAGKPIKRQSSFAIDANECSSAETSWFRGVVRHQTRTLYPPPFLRSPTVKVESLQEIAPRIPQAIEVKSNPKGQLKRAPREAKELYWLFRRHSSGRSSKHPAKCDVDWSGNTIHWNGQIYREGPRLLL